MNKFEINIQDSAVEKNILSRKAISLRNLFRSSKNPIDIILQEIDSDKIKESVDASVLDEVKGRLSGATFEDEEEFVSKVFEIAQPIWEVTQKDRQDLVKQPDREMFASEDVREAAKIITESGSQRVYVVGNVGSGKSTFARELAVVINFKNIDLDHFFSDIQARKK